MSERAGKALEFAFVCSLSGGLHARPASHLAEAANIFSSDFLLTNQRSGATASLKSVLAIIAADVRPGDRCTIEVTGVDEEKALAGLRSFIEQQLPSCDVPLAASVAPQSKRALPRVLASDGAHFCFGSPVSDGIGEGKVVLLAGARLPRGMNGRPAGNAQQEMEQITSAIASVRARIRAKLGHSKSLTEAAVLEADLAMAGDVFLSQKLAEHVSGGKSASQAIAETGDFFIDLLRRSNSDYIRERALDVEEICLQLLDEIHGGSLNLVAVNLSEPSVVFAETLAPQQLLSLDQRWLKAVVLGHSSANSHAVILARSLGIPVVAGAKEARRVLRAGEEVLVDGSRGLVATQLSPRVRQFYERERAVLSRRRELLMQHSRGPAKTLEGVVLEVSANAASGEELNSIFDSGADGIGLFRTEGLFLGRENSPSEEEQFAVYQEAARSAGGKPVIIRTFDLGGDKTPAYFGLPHEKNPFLGMRGARLYREHSGVLQSQLRAILRASVSGQIWIMAPMISSLSEVLEFKRAITEAKQSLIRDGLPFQADIRTGIMIEVPAAAFVIKQLCHEVDFFSLGTNDLSQYFFAADRENEGVATVANALHPGFLRFLQEVVADIHAGRKWVGLCGQMAADTNVLPFLVGMDLDELSVPSANVPDIKNAVSQLSTADCKRLLESAIACRDAADVKQLLAEAHTWRFPPPLLSENLVLLDSGSRNKEEAIQEIVNAFYVAGRTEDRQRLEDALWSREAVYSTGLGFGFAAPHCKTDAINADTIGVLKLSHPIDWGSVDGQPVRMVLLLTMRETQAGSRHMQVFSRLARKLMNEEFREQLLHLQEANKIMSYLSHELEISTH